jgi:acetoin utilization deacetylase AcuC-like enzyme
MDQVAEMMARIDSAALDLSRDYTPEMVAALREAMIEHKTLAYIAGGMKIEAARRYATIQITAWENQQWSLTARADRKPSGA